MSPARGSPATLEGMAHAVEAGTYLVPVIPAWPTPGGLNPAAQCVTEALRNAVAGFAQPPGAQQAPAQPGESFLAQDAFSNPEHVHFALKTTGAAVFCYCLYSLLDWPGIHTCFLTCYIVAQSTAAESVEKLTLRITGCLIGSAAGLAAIVFVVPSLTSIGDLLLVEFAGACAAAYIAAGSPRISYAGFQFAFAFLLCLIQGSGPQFDLTIARDRIIGILVGNLVAYFAYVHIWPMSICRRIDPALASMLNQLRSLIVAHDGRERQLAATQVHSILSAARSDLAPRPLRACGDPAAGSVVALASRGHRTQPLAVRAVSAQQQSG